MTFTEVVHRYPPDLADRPADDAHDVLSIPLDQTRADARLDAALLKPVLLRDGLLTLADVLRNDLRRAAGDRADYLAYLLSKGKRATQAVWDAQKAFLAEQYGEATQREAPLDPLLSIGADGVDFEVFSRDESSYARLHLRAGDGYRADRTADGTSHFAFTPALLDQITALRDYRPTELRCAAADSATAGGERKVLRVPYRWLRAFGQVQTAATLPARHFRLDPIDLYNVLFSLRMRKAKTAPRALRFELVPGERPRLVLEPWEQLLPATGPVYDGAAPLVVRTWGRQRLSVLSRLLPHARGVDVYLLGAGLPAFYRLDLGSASLTLALSGWTDSGWAGVAAFDLLTPGEIDEVLAKRALAELERQPADLDTLSEALGRPRQAVREALLSEVLRGRLLIDIDSGRYRRRDLTAEPLDVARLRYRDAGEEQAHRLLAEPGQVEITRIHDDGDGTEIGGEVDDRAAHRRYRSAFTLDREGRTVDASCSCRQFRRSGLKQGPCPHMIALRLAYLRQQQELERARQSESGRRLIRAETRTLVKRDDRAVRTYRLSLDDRQVVQRWGSDPNAMRVQRLLFSDAERARVDYFKRLDGLLGKGFIDASAAQQ